MSRTEFVVIALLSTLGAAVLWPGLVRAQSRQSPEDLLSRTDVCQSEPDDCSWMSCELNDDGSDELMSIAESDSLYRAVIDRWVDEVLCVDCPTPDIETAAGHAGGAEGATGPLIPDGLCICPRIAAPVCGADGWTYGNRCAAECLGVEVEHRGECEGGRRLPW